MLLRHMPRQVRVVTRALACTLFLATSSATAWAEDYPPCEKTPTADDVEAAKGMHKAAEQYYAKARYDRAISSWMDAYSFDCTAHRLLINVGNAYEKLGQTEKAIRAFEVYIERMGDEADRNIVDKVNNLRELLKTKPPDAPNPVAPNPTPDPTPLPDPEPDHSDGDPGPGPWILVGGGVAAAIVGAVLLGVGIGKEAEAEEACPTRECTDPEVTALGNEGLNLQIAGGTVMAVGLVAVAGGVVWYLVDSSVSTAELHELPVRIDVGAGPGGAGLSLSGSF